MREGNEWAVMGYDKVLNGTVDALDGDEKAIKMCCDGLNGE